MLQKLQERAYSVFATFHTGIASVHTATHKVSDNPDAPDVLEVLGGRTSVISGKSSSSSPSSNPVSSPRSHQSLGEDNAGSPRDLGDSQMEYGHFDTQAVPHDAGLRGAGLYYTAPRAESAVGMLHQTVEAGAAAPPPVLGYDQPVFVAAQRYADLGGSEYMHTQGLHPHAQPHLVPLSHAGPPAHQQHHPHASAVPMEYTSTLTGQQQTQEDIWRSFVHQLGLQGANS